jgi:hypothetical protein
MTLPTREEINVYDSLDERVACDHFLGKSLDEAEALFRENSLYYQECLMWMGPIAFRYYVQAVIKYIQSDASTGDDHIISCLAGILEYWLEFEPLELVAMVPQLAAVCRYILDHYDRYAIDPNIHGDLRPRYQALLPRLSRIHQ